MKIIRWSMMGLMMMAPLVFGGTLAHAFTLPANSVPSTQINITPKHVNPKVVPKKILPAKGSQAIIQVSPAQPRGVVSQHVGTLKKNGARPALRAPKPLFGRGAPITGPGGKTPIPPSSTATQAVTGYASCTPPATGLPRPPARRMHLGNPDRGRVRVTSNIKFSPSSYNEDSDQFITGVGENGVGSGGDCGYIYCPHPADRFRLYNVAGGGKKLAASSLHAQINGTTATITLPPRLEAGEYKIGLVQGGCSLPPLRSRAFQERGYRDTGARLTDNSFRVGVVRTLGTRPHRGEVFHLKSGAVNKRPHSGFAP